MMRRTVGLVLALAVCMAASGKPLHAQDAFADSLASEGWKDISAADRRKGGTAPGVCAVLRVASRQSEPTRLGRYLRPDSLTKKTPDSIEVAAMMPLAMNG